MRTHHIRHVIAFILIAAFTSNFATADEAEVHSAIQDYVAAFNEKDVAKVSSMWSENASHVDQALVERTNGRTAIMEDIQEVFEQPLSCLLSGTVDRIRMITPTVASVSGEVVVTVGSDLPSVNQFSAILIKQDGSWMIDSMEEMPVTQPESSAAALSQLDWLVGTWQDIAQEYPVRATVKPSIGGAYLVRSFEATSPEGESMMSSQVIGWDARQNQIRSWTFDSDGSHGEGVWSKAGDQWMIKSVQTLADGRLASGTYVMTLVDGDSFTVQLIGREIEGEPQPSSDPITVKRVEASTETTNSDATTTTDAR